MKEKIEFENENFNPVNKHNQRKNLIYKFLLGIIFIAICAIIIVIVIKRKNMDAKLYEAKTSNYEIYCETKAYIVNNETIVDYDKNSTIVTLAKATKRIAVNDVIAMYKTSEYDKNKTRLADLDSKINEKVKLLPSTYSNEIVQVENEIDSLIQEVKNTSSYIKINEYKTKLDDLSYKKIKIMASLNPSATELLSLINERDAFKENMNKSLTNIVANISGVIIYKTDGLENKFSVGDFDLDKIKSVIKEYESPHEEVFGIKIVDNFETYLIIKEDIENKIYMNEGDKYTIELLSKEDSLVGQLKNIITDEESSKVYCVFRVTNGVENLVESRMIDIKVIWKRYNGFLVDNTSIVNKDNVDYIRILSLNEYIDIPVKVLLKLKDKSLVVNYTKSELEQNGIERQRSLLLYDRIVKDAALVP